MVTAAGSLTQTGRRAGLALGLAGSLLAAAPPTPGQDIIQAHVLDLSVLEVQVIVTGARGDDQVRCLLRDAGGRVRVGGSQRVGAGATTGRTTVVAIPLPVLDPGEREFSVTLVRGETMLARTDWRRLPGPGP
jgi:hypothetical protein